jgi:gluconokinase
MSRMVVILTGVASSGKTTVGEVLAQRLGWRFYDGDDFHSARNREKMHRGEPLTDEDRKPWLEELHELIIRCEREGENAVLACSALKQAHRDRLTAGSHDVRLVYLKGPRDLIATRLAARHGHFFDPALLQSQFDALEEPSDALAVDISGTPEHIADAIVDGLALAKPERSCG